MALATLSIDLEARLARFEQQLDRAARMSEKQAAAVQAAWAKGGAAIGTVLAGAGGALAGYSLVDALRQNIDFIDSLNDMADATGSTIERLSGLVDLAERTGTSSQVAETALIKLNAALNDTDPDSTASRALKAIGVSADELRKADPVDALVKVAQALAQYENDGNKARLVQELLGKSARELAPLLKDLGEAGQLNAKYTREQAEEAERFNKQLFEFQANAASASRAFINQLLPALNQFFDAVRGKETGGQGPISELITVPLQTAAIVGSDVAFVMRGIGTEIGGIAAQLASLARLDLKGFKFIGDAMKADAADARSELDAFQARIMAIGKGREAGADRGQSLPTVGQLPPKAEKASAPPKEKIDEATKALMRYIDQLGNQLVKIQDLTAVEEAEIELRKLGWNGAEQGSAAVVLQLARELDMRKQGVEFSKAMTAEMERQAKELSGLDEALMKFSGRIDDARKQALTARLEERLAMGETFAPEELDKIVNGIAGITEASQEKLDEFTAQAARNIQDGLGQTLLRTMKGDFDGILDLWSNMLQQMVAQALAAKLNNALLGDNFAKTGELGGWAKAGFDWLGTVMPKFADGGDHRGGLRLVGERGPELEATGPARYYNAAQTAQMLRQPGAATGGAMVVHQNFHLSGPADQRTQQQLAAAAARGLDNARRRNS